MFVKNKSQALYWFNFYNGNVKFVPLTTEIFTGKIEKEYIFSHAIAKFQDLVRFEEPSQDPPQPPMSSGIIVL